MRLRLNRPLAFIDLETTGTDIGRDRIVEMAIIKRMPDGTEQCMPDTSVSSRLLINPGIPIPAESTKLHGISDADVAEAPTFAQLAPEVFAFIEGCDLAGFNSNKFDIPLLAEEFLRAGMDFSVEERHLIDVQVIFHFMEPRNLRAGYRFYCGRELDGAHEAMADTRATLEILEAMVKRYADTELALPDGTFYKPVNGEVSDLHRLSARQRRADLAGHVVLDDEGKARFNFGKYKGHKVEEVFQRDTGYFGWLMQADFPLYTKKVLRQIRESMKVQ